MINALKMVAKLGASPHGVLMLPRGKLTNYRWCARIVHFVQ